MATSMRSQGNAVQVVAPTAGYTSDQLIIMRSGTTGYCAVVAADIAAAATGAAWVEGEFELPANAGTGLTFAVGDILYRKSSDAKLTKSTTGNTKVGVCTRAKGASGTTGFVKLIPN